MSATRHLLIDVVVPAKASVVLAGRRNPAEVDVTYDATVCIAVAELKDAPVAVMMGDVDHPHHRNLARAYAGSLWQPLRVVPKNTHKPIIADTNVLRMMLRGQIETDNGFVLGQASVPIPPDFRKARQVLDTGRKAAERKAAEIEAAYLLLDDHAYRRISRAPAWRFDIYDEALSLSFELPCSEAPSHCPICVHVPVGMVDAEIALAAMAKATGLEARKTGRAAEIRVLRPEAAPNDALALLAADTRRIVHVVGGSTAFSTLAPETLDAWIDVRIAVETPEAPTHTAFEVARRLERFSRSIVSTTPEPRFSETSRLARKAMEGSKLLDAWLDLPRNPSEMAA